MAIASMGPVGIATAAIEAHLTAAGVIGVGAIADVGIGMSGTGVDTETGDGAIVARTMPASALRRTVTPTTGATGPGV